MNTQYGWKYFQQKKQNKASEIINNEIAILEYQTRALGIVQEAISKVR